MKHEDTPIEEAKLDADEPNEVLRASITDLQSDSECGSAEPDWDRLQAKLFARIERERAPKKNNVVWLAVAATLAAAAAGALWMGKTPDETATVIVAVDPAPQSVVASALLEGQAQINGANAVVGREVFANERVTSQAGSAIFDRANKARWLLESNSAVSIEHAEGPLVLALEKGGAEAQVVPVPNGEAFAIDVTSSKGNVVRVAVHGTHLRVARVGDHVTVDLTEGVVSVGAPPKRGSTLGELVTAPAHVEFDIDTAVVGGSLGGLLDVRHDASSVRAAVSLSPEGKVTINDTPAPKPESTAKPSPQPAITSPIATPKPAPMDAIAADPNINERISNTVRSFVRAQQSANGVTVIPPKSVTLKIELSDDGYVRTVTFDPPLSPDVQKRIADTLFDPKKTRFVATVDHQARVDVNIEAP